MRLIMFNNNIKIYRIVASLLAILIILYCYCGVLINLTLPVKNRVH